MRIELKNPFLYSKENNYPKNGSSVDIILLLRKI